MNRWFPLAALLAATLCSGTPAGASAAMRYVATPLPSLYGLGASSFVYPAAINARGEVACTECTGPEQGLCRATLYSGGTVRDLGGLGGEEAWARDLSNAGEVVGIAESASRQFIAFAHSGGVMRALGALPGDAESGATGISASGAIVGYSRDTATGLTRAFIRESGAMTALGTAGFLHSIAWSVNAHGHVTGDVYGGGRQAAFLWTRGTMTLIAANESSGRDINDHGEVAGWFTNATGELRAFLYSAGTVRDLGSLGGSRSGASAVNNLGTVVGFADTAAGTRAFVWIDGTMRDLNLLVVSGLKHGHVLHHAQSINDTGQIVAVSNLHPFAPSYAYRLDPVEAFDVPAQSSQLLVATCVVVAAVGGMVLRRHARRH